MRANICNEKLIKIKNIIINIITDREIRFSFMNIIFIFKCIFYLSIDQKYLGLKYFKI